MTVSAGVATQGADGQHWDELVSAADTALYDEAENAGRNRLTTTNAATDAVWLALASA